MKPSLEDPRVVAAVRDYQARLEAGEEPDPKRLADRFPEIAEELNACLSGLALVHAAKPRLREPEVEPDGTPTTPVGDFRIRREIGRGGMGVVYEAEQMSLGRRVALKVLPFASVLDSRYLQRFKNEAQAAANLHHTNIVPVHSVGCDRGVHFYAMQYIDGMSVAEMIEQLRAAAKGGDGPPSTHSSSVALAAVTGGSDTGSRDYCRAVARLGAQAAGALDHAHAQGVIHRDIKPGNLLVDVDGRLWVTDFGLAAFTKNDGPTMTGDLVGTVRYMSPEQALAQRAPVDHRTDIYSLGITLYELLTLEHAFAGGDPHHVIQAIAFQEPTAPRRLNPAVPEELETIVQKAIAKSPADRYATARELAEDLERFLEDRPILAKKPSLPKRVVQWSRRHRHVTRAAAVVLLLTIAGLAASIVLITKEKNRAQDTARRLETNYARSRAMLETVLRRVGDAMAFEPNLSATHTAILEDALAFFEGLARQDPTDSAARREIALARAGAGWARHVLSRHDEAERDYATAMRELTALEAEEPGDHLADLIELCERRGQLLIDMKKREEAAASFAEGLRYTATLQMLRPPADPEPRRLQARLFMAQGRLFEYAGEDARAIDAYERARITVDALAAETKGVTARADLAECWHRLAEVWRRGGEKKRWRAAWEEAWNTVIALERENPDEPRVRWLSSAIQRQSAIGMQREIEAMEFPDSPEHDPEFDRDGSELGPEPIEFRAMTWGNRMRPVSLEDEAGFEDFPERAGFFRHESQGRSNVLGEFTGVAWVYGLQCHPGLKGLTAVTWRTKEGDELWLNFEVTRNLNDTYEGTYFIVGGTGRLAGARGYGTVRTEQNDRIGPYGVRRGVIWRE